MEELMKLSKEKKFNLFVALCIAFFAAFSTAFFAVTEGVKNSYTILFRMVVSFSIFAVIGYFLGDFFKQKYLSKLLTDDESGEPLVASEDVEEPPADSENEVDAENPAEAESQDNDNLPIFEDDSFDKIVVMDDDAEKDK